MSLNEALKKHQEQLDPLAEAIRRKAKQSVGTPGTQYYHLSLAGNRTYGKRDKIMDMVDAHGGSAYVVYPGSDRPVRIG